MEEPRKAGRPRRLPDGARQQSYRATDEEHRAVLAYLERLRKKNARKPQDSQGK